MITLIHGDDIATSRNYLQKLRSEASGIVLLDGEKSNIEEIAQNISGTTLFGDAPTIIIENLLVGKKKKDLQDQIIAYLKSNKDVKVIFWEDAVVSKTAYAKLPKVESHEFSLPKSLFSFLDNIYPNNARLIPLFHQALEGSEPEMLFFMMTRQIRLLLAVLEPSPDAIDEMKRLTWQLPKLQKQARLFGKENLLKTHAKLFQIEKGMKTGGLTMSLTGTIDFFLLEL